MNNGKTILLVEDNPRDIELTLQAFRQNNFAGDVAIARNGAEALVHLFGRGSDAYRALPQIVLLKPRLPRVSGLEVLRAMRSDPRTRQIPVVMLASATELNDLIAGYNLGANSFVRKPVNAGDFIRALQQLWMYWLVLNEPAPTEGCEASGGTQMPQLRLCAAEDPL